MDNKENRKKPTRKAAISSNESQGTREKCKFGIRASFGIDLGFEQDGNTKGADGKPIPREREVTGFTEPTPWTPEIDPAYVFPAEETKALLLGLEVRDRILLTGDTGTGKTSLLEQVAARLNYGVVKLNFDGAVTRSDLIGEWVVKGKEMTFQYGILPKSFQMPGTIIILDEWDTISSECAFVLQRPLQKDDGKILIMETGGELIPLHEDNVIAATANTIGLGDEGGLYRGTNIQNYSQLNRFGMTIKMSYLPREQEIEMLQKRMPDLSQVECETMVQSISQVREAYTNGQISVPLSPRDLINWADKYLRMGDLIRAAKYCFLNRMPPEDHLTVEQMIQRNCGE